MKPSRMLSAGVASAVLAFGVPGVSACGADPSETEPASLEEIQQKVNEAFDAEAKAKRAEARFEKRAEEARENLENAIDEAQEQVESDRENPSY